jgi:hypothetical protein
MERRIGGQDLTTHGVIDQPKFFEEALRSLLDKDPSPHEWDSADWGGEKPAVRVRSFFSSRVERR